jgi:hypothetical protein
VRPTRRRRGARLAASAIPSRQTALPAAITGSPQSKSEPDGAGEEAEAPTGALLVMPLMSVRPDS